MSYNRSTHIVTCDGDDCDAEIEVVPYLTKKIITESFGKKAPSREGVANQLRAEGWVVFAQGQKHYCDVCKNVLGNVLLNDETHINRRRSELND